ncbi:type II toxin-antitoxin system RelE/ParE family toxin [Anatilimnocola floriformis]|uniref:type II toxin-antitoxin system RelE/ParE family toxin n=1 Tax=Anatilimnocola floriformis TaxID=2948575 RepID=UPI0020C273A4|nr:type II toxin-antitoxin system RelE/ParE family toxin [Anatilimnocola floriformis]
MSLPVIFRPAASSDISDIVAHYDSVTAGLGQRFFELVKGRLLLVANHPKLFATIYRHVRAMRVPKFPFIVYYRAHSNRIEVFAVVHGSRDESAWKSRL